jgi:hypothetical protein
VGWSFREIPPADERSPKRQRAAAPLKLSGLTHSLACHSSARSWSAAVLCRFRSSCPPARTARQIPIWNAITNATGAAQTLATPHSLLRRTRHFISSAPPTGAERGIERTREFAQQSTLAHHTSRRFQAFAKRAPFLAFVPLSNRLLPDAPGKFRSHNPGSCAIGSNRE